MPILLIELLRQLKELGQDTCYCLIQEIRYLKESNCGLVEHTKICSILQEYNITDPMCYLSGFADLGLLDVIWRILW